jgi:WD40 repeat protein
MHRPLALLLAAGLVALAAEPAPAQQPKPKLTLQALGEQKFELKRHIHVIGFSPDGKQLAAGEDNVHLFDVTGESAKQVGVFNSRIAFGIRALSYSRDGKYVIFGGADNTVRVWSVDGKVETGKGTSHRGDILSVATSPDGKHVATGSNDRSAILWNLSPDGKLTEQAVLKAEDKFGDSSVRSVAFTTGPKGVPLLVTASYNGTLRAFTVSGVTKQVSLLKAKTSFGDANLTSNPKGTLWAFSVGHTVYLIDAKANPLGVFGAAGVGHKENVRDLSFSPDGKLLASVAGDGTLFVWDVATKAARYNKTRPGRFSSVAFSPYQDPVTGDLTLAAGLEDGDVHLVKLGYR